MRFKVGMTDTLELMSQAEADVAAALTRAQRATTDALKADWRGQIRDAGLGSRLANTVQGRTYPLGGESLDPASWVFTKAGRIVDAFDRGPTILPTGGRFYLAIPTAQVPRRAGKRMTPVEVEAFFDQDLIIFRSRRGNLKAYVDVAYSRFRRSQGRAYGRGTRVRTTRPKPKLVQMFTLVARTRLTKRLDIARLASSAAARYPGLLTQAWLVIPNRTAAMKGL